jgi:hypothetical protein
VGVASAPADGDPVAAIPVDEYPADRGCPRCPPGALVPQQLGHRWAGGVRAGSLGTPRPGAGAWGLAPSPRLAPPGGGRTGGRLPRTQVETRWEGEEVGRHVREGTTCYCTPG